MRKVIFILGLLVAIPLAMAQVNLTTIPTGTTLVGNELVLMQQPPSACNNCTVTTTPAAIATYVLGQQTSNEVQSLFGCGGSSSLFLNGGGGCTTPPLTPPGGTSSQIQYNSSGAFGGFTLGGDCSLSVPNITCTKTNGTAFGSFATQNYATPPAIGGTTPNSGAFTAVTGTSAVIGSPTGGNEGTGSINVQSIYVNGVQPLSSLIVSYAEVSSNSGGSCGIAENGSNFASCTYNSAGDYTYNFSTSYAHGVYCTASVQGGFAGVQAVPGLQVSPPSLSAVNLSVVNSSGTLTNYTADYYIVCVGT